MISLMIYTDHSCSTDLEWNPLYIQVGRENNLEWKNKGYYYNPTTNHREYSSDYINIYDHLFNIDTLDKELKSIIS